MACLLIVKRLKYKSDDGKLERKHCNVVGLNVKGNSKSLSFNSKGARHGLSSSYLFAIYLFGYVCVVCEYWIIYL